MVNNGDIQDCPRCGRRVCWQYNYTAGGYVLCEVATRTIISPNSRIEIEGYTPHNCSGTFEPEGKSKVITEGSGY